MSNYCLEPEEHSLTKYIAETTEKNRDRPPSIIGRLVGKPLGNAFWGRISGFDTLSVKRMLKKEPDLILANWYDVTPIIVLFMGRLNGKKVKDDLSEETYLKHQKRFLDMLRILCKAGAVIEAETLLPYFERYPFHNEEFAKKVFQCLLKRGLKPDNYKILDENEIMHLENIKYTNEETYVFWGRKVVSDYLRLKTRMLYHVELRNNTELCYDVIGYITSFL